MNRIRVLLADDHEGFRRILASFLRTQPGVELVGEAVDGQDAVDQSNRLQPDLVLIDVHMPRQTGVEATRTIKVRHPHTKVIMMSVDPSESYQRSALEVADAYVPKTSIKDDLTSILNGLGDAEQRSVAVA